MLWGLFELAPSPTLEDSLEEGGLLVDSCWFTFRCRQRALRCAGFYDRVWRLFIVICMFSKTITQTRLLLPAASQCAWEKGYSDKAKVPSSRSFQVCEGRGLVVTSITVTNKSGEGDPEKARRSKKENL